MLRIAVTGTESSHVDHFLRHLNVEQRFGDAGVTVLVGGEPGRTRELAATGAVATVVESVEEAAPLVDAAIVADRDGRVHLEQARPFLTRGLPVLVDKPLAASTGDAESILGLARAHGGRVASFSALRFGPDVAALAAEIEGLGGVRALALTGPADPDDPRAGLFFYGIHLAELAVQFTGAGVQRMHVERTGGVVTAWALVNDVHVVLTFVRADGDAQVPFHATVTGSRGVAGREIEVGPDYCAPGLERFVAMARTGVAVLDDEAMLAPVRLLESVSRAV